MKHVVAAIIVRPSDNKILICQRAKGQPLGLKWEFPGGKIEPGEEAIAALKRELREELDIEAEIGNEVERFVHTYRNGNAVELAFFHVETFSGEMKNKVFQDFKWVNREELPRFDFLEADVKLVREIANGKIV